MTPTVLALVVISAALHPLRDFLIKGDQTPEGVTLAVIIYFGLCSGLHVMATGIDPWTAFTVWPMMAISGLAIISYYVCVIGTLREGDLSIYYPIMRSSPLFVVVVGFLFLGHRYSPGMLAGIAMVLVGAFMLQYDPRSRLLSQPKTLALAVLAMSLHGIITLADAEAMRQVEPMAYVFVQYLFLIPITGVIFAATGPRDRSIYRHLFSGWWTTPYRYFTAGVTAYISYYLILKAFQLGANVAAVSAVRQISIPMSVLLGGIVLKELRMTGRLSWSLLLAAGVVAIVLSR